MPSARYPKNAATTETSGPKPSFNTMYGYDAPITTAAAKPQRIDRKDNSRTSAGFTAAACTRSGPVNSFVISLAIFFGIEVRVYSTRKRHSLEVRFCVFQNFENRLAIGFGKMGEVGACVLTR